MKYDPKQAVVTETKSPFDAPAYDVQASEHIMTLLAMLERAGVKDYPAMRAARAFAYTRATCSRCS